MLSIHSEIKWPLLAVLEVDFILTSEKLNWGENETYGSYLKHEIS